MTWAFNPNEGLIIVAAEISGPAGVAIVRMAIDTGSTHTTVRDGLLEDIGYEPCQSPNKVQVTTGGGLLYVPVVHVARIRALGLQIDDIPITAIPFPETASVDGVIGLDILRGHVITVDLREGKLSVD